jgi:inhibitor of cysteine peptidase
MKNLTIILLLGFVLIVGCMSTNNIQPINYDNLDLSSDLSVKKFSSDAELISFLKENQGSSGYGYFGSLENRLMSSEVAMDSSTKSSEITSASGSNDYSETNVQVEGIDEADIIKTDGNYIYLVQDNVFYIVDVNKPEDAKIIYKEEFKNNLQFIFINENKLALMGSLNDIEFIRSLEYSPTRGLSFLNVYDISNKEKPNLEKEYKFDGRIFQSRMKDGNVYVVTNTFNDYHMPRPIFFDGGREIAIKDIYYYNVPYNNPSFVNLYSINIDSFEYEMKSIIMDRLETLYMSNDNIFLSHTQNINEYEFRQEILIDLIKPMIVKEDKDLILKIEATDNDILNKYEKQAKILDIINSYFYRLNEDERKNIENELEDLVEKKLKEYEYMQYTIIHKINFVEGKLNIDVSGKVPGRLLNQFSMDEHENVLRVGTTVDGRWDMYGKERTLSTNHVFTLDNNLEILDSLDNLAEDERIYSTRFIEDKLYMVTFRQIDPFFVIDLSDPKNIKNLGELKIPGFSRYLHPYDESTIIGLGQEADERTGRTTGLKVSLFDVSDVSNPKEITKFVAEGEYSSSTAEFEHKAFLFSRQKNLLVIPINSYSWQNPQNNYAGALVFNITKDEINLRGLIDHSIGQQYSSGVERSLFIENILYTKSPGLLRSNLLSDLSSVKNITLESKGPYIVY